MHTWQQLRAVAVLVLRSLHRVGPRVRGGRKAEPTRGVSAVLMRLLFAGLIYNFGFTSGMRIPLQAEPSWSATWAALGAGCCLMTVPLSLELPSPRVPTSALKSHLLEALPLSQLSKLLLVLAQGLLLLPLPLALALTLHSKMTPTAPLLGAVALALVLFSSFVLAGACLAKALKLVLSAYRASRLSWLASLPMIAGMLLLQVAASTQVLGRPVMGDSLGRALAGQQPWPVVAVLGALTLGLGAAFVWLERGQELSEPVPPDPTASALGEGADMRAIERVITRREPGGSFQVPFATLFSTAFVGAMVWTQRTSELGLSALWSLAAVITLQMVATLGMQRATRAATRDMLARPLLGALPIAPRDTLESKAAMLRRSLFTVSAPLCLVFGATVAHPSWLGGLAWRAGAALLAVGIYASAATYVAFLTTGLGSSTPRGGVFGSLESFLVVVPFAGVFFAPGPGSALLSLGTLAAVTYEARRAALRSIDWLDDPEREHSTEVWKALVVFGGFQGAQLLTQQLASLFRGVVSPTVQMLSAYLVAGLALWITTQRGQESSAPRHRAALAPLGIAAGALSAGFAWVYVRLAAPLAEGAGRMEVSGTGEAVLLALVAVGVAPIVEERFFRGWLQPALESSLAEHRRTYLAPLLTGLAFAAAHPAYSFAPVLVLGIINGFLMLRFRSLSACVVAHVVQNAFALYLAR
ncbi:MAG TPA: CPBP family intramembrane glutamic endopeptidase [Polyangiaceae bacterium]